jgi:CheY-like chemotaxis protein
MPEKRKQVLFVDDDEQFLDLLQGIMTHHAGDRWLIHTATDVGKALGVLQERPIDLLVIDVHMPVIDGLQFLGLLRRTYPDLLRVVLTGDATESYRASCLNAGAELFLEKPVTEEGWRNIYTTLDALARFKPREGFRGVLRTVGLQEILQMECLARNSSLLEINARDFQGKIFIHKGAIVHAQAGARTGEEAFNYLLALKGGEFNLQPFSEPPQCTITEPWEFLLMEAARKRDEASEASAQIQAPGSIPAAATPVPSGPERAAEPISAPEPTATERPGAPDVEDLRPEIEEMVVASPQGDMLYEWQCSHPSERIRFLEFVSQRARQLVQGLPLGPFDRLEIEDASTRIVTQVQADRTLFVRRAAVAIDAAT